MSSGIPGTAWRRPGPNGTWFPNVRAHFLLGCGNGARSGAGRLPGACVCGACWGHCPEGCCTSAQNPVPLASVGSLAGATLPK